MLDDGSLIEEIAYDDGKIISKVSYLNHDVLEANKDQRNSFTKHEQYKGNFVHAARIYEGDVIRLKNMGYNLLSPDREEWKRCVLYIQQNEPDLLCVNGKPFAKRRSVWA